MDGQEVVQLYSSKSDSKIERAAQELKGFQKVLVTAGKSEIVTLQVPVKELAYYNVETQKWTVESGNYTLKLGNSSVHIAERSRGKPLNKTKNEKNICNYFMYSFSQGFLPVVQIQILTQRHHKIKHLRLM